jgi:hypothetical protein
LAKVSTAELFARLLARTDLQKLQRPVLIVALLQPRFVIDARRLDPVGHVAHARFQRRIGHEAMKHDAGRPFAQRALQTNAQQSRCGLVLRTSGEKGFDFTTVDYVVFQKLPRGAKSR